MNWIKKKKVKIYIKFQPVAPGASRAEAKCLCPPASPRCGWHAELVPEAEQRDTNTHSTSGWAVSSLTQHPLGSSRHDVSVVSPFHMAYHNMLSWKVLRVRLSMTPKREPSRGKIWCVHRNSYNCDQWSQSSSLKRDEAVFCIPDCLWVFMNHAQC